MDSKFQVETAWSDFFWARYLFNKVSGSARCSPVVGFPQEHLNV